MSSTEPNTERVEFLRFLIAVGGAVAIAAALGASFNYVVSDKLFGFEHQLPRYQSEVIDRKIPIKSAEVLLLGDSVSARTLLATELREFPALSLAASGGGSVESYYLLVRYLEQFPDPRCVVLMTSYGAYSYHREVLFWPTIVQHSTLRPQDTFDLYFTSSSIGGWPASQYSWIEYLVRFLNAKLGFWLRLDTINRWFFGAERIYLDASLSYRILRRHIGSTPLTTFPYWLDMPFDGPNQRYLKSPFTIDATIDHYLKKILELTSKRGIKFYFSYGPIANGLKTETSERWLSDAMKHLQTIIDRYPHAKNLAEIEWRSDTEFSDGTHLKMEEAVEYTNALKPRFQDCRR